MVCPFLCLDKHFSVIERLAGKEAKRGSAPLRPDLYASPFTDWESFGQNGTSVFLTSPGMASNLHLVLCLPDLLWTSVQLTVVDFSGV
jgi:hypothetical protein